MLLPLVFQIISLLPPPMDTTADTDPVYLEKIRALAAEPVWQSDAIQALEQGRDEAADSLINLIRRGTDAEVRLAALLCAGVAGDSPLGTALWRRAAQDFEEARVMACLLAPKDVPDAALPLLAWIASDPSRSLPQRAAACARLLDADVLGAWPLAEAMLRTGTASDTSTGIADWPRRGRYELPKRVLLHSVQDLLQRQALPSTDFEPNAAWNAQEEDLAEIRTSLQSTLASLKSVSAEGRPWMALKKQVERGQLVAIRAQELLRR